jgi:MFS family permease
VTDRQPTQRLPAGIWALGFVSLLMDVSSELIHSLLPVFLVTGLGASMFTVGLLEGAAEATALIIKVFSGALSDWWGKRKPLAVLGYSLGAFSKPLFALATSVEPVITARLLDRVGKGIRGAPRDALVADIAPPEMRGAAFGLRQSLDTVGAFLGPLLAMGLMLLWANDFHAVFWVAVIPAFLCVALLVLGVQEPTRPHDAPRTHPIRRENLRRLTRPYWWVVSLGAVFTLARFSEAFLVLRAQEGGLDLAWAPLVLIAMNLIYALGAYPCGKLADRMSRRAVPKGNSTAAHQGEGVPISHQTLLAWGLWLLIAADVLLTLDNHGPWLWTGIALWGLHMAMTQGLLATMVADTAPADLRGTAFGMFNLVSGMALLLASTLAGVLWDQFGARFTFAAGALFSLIALLLVALRQRQPTP